MVRIFREIATSLGAIAPDLGLVPSLCLCVYVCVYISLSQVARPCPVPAALRICLSVAPLVPPFLRPRSFVPSPNARANTSVPRYGSPRVLNRARTRSRTHSTLWSRPRITSSIRRPAPSTRHRGVPKSAISRHPARSRPISASIHAFDRRALIMYPATDTHEHRLGVNHVLSPSTSVNVDRKGNYRYRARRGIKGFLSFQI